MDSCCASSSPPANPVDPVCGMKVDPKAGKPSSVYKGKTYFFCCASCKNKFDLSPEKYQGGKLAPSAPLPSRPPKVSNANAIYTCPMHPEVEQKGPGSCPLCGMALEPLHPSLEEPEDSEYLDLLHRFKVSAALSAPLLALGMGGERLLPFPAKWLELEIGRAHV